MTDKLRLTATSLEDIANHFEYLANTEIAKVNSQQTLKGQAACHLRSRVWLEAAEILRATTIETKPTEYDQFDKDRRPRVALAAMLIGAPGRSMSDSVSPAATNTEIVGIVARTRYQFNVFAREKALECGGSFNSQNGTLKLANGKRYVYIYGEAKLRGLELSSFQSTPDAYLRDDYSELMRILPSRVRRQVTK